MATLFNTKISATYEGLFKTIDNAAITASLKELTDGSGNQSGLYVNNAGDFKVSNILEWGSLKDTGTGVTITRYVTSTDGIENFDNNTSLPTSAAVKLYVDTKFATSDTLQEVLSFGNTTGGNDIVVSANDDITFTDSSKAIFGAGSDFEIFHNGTSDFIVAKSPYNIFEAQNHIFRNIAQNKDYAKFLGNSSVELYWNGIIKFQTSETGATLAGRLSGLTDPTLAQDAATKSYVDALDAGSDLDFKGDNGTAGDVNLNTQRLDILGTANQITTVSSGQSLTIGMPTNITISGIVNATTFNGDVTGNVTGDLTGTASLIDVSNTATNQNQYLLQSAGTLGSQTVFANSNLYFNPVTNLLTVDGSGTFTGDLNVTGNITGGGGSFLPLAGGTMTGNTIHNDNVKSIYGTASDGLEIYHDGTHSYLEDTGTGDLRIKTNGAALALLAPSNEDMILAVPNSFVKLYFNNSEKLATTNTGISVTGNVVPTANVHIQDAGQLQLGTGINGKIYHDGNNFIANNLTGDLYIDQAAVTKSIFFRVSNANALDTTALTINREGDLTTGADVTIAGNLTVNGTTTTINTQTLAVEDPLIELSKDNGANSVDIGFYGKYNDGTARYLGLFSDASDSNKFRLFKGTTVQPTTTVNIAGAGYVAADLQVAGLEATTIATSGTVSVGNTLYVTEYIQHLGDTNNNIRFQASRMTLQSKASASAKVDLHDNGQLYLASGGGTSLTLDTSQNATFAGTISVASGTISVLGGNNMTLAGPASHGGISFATNSILPATAATTNDNVFDIGATTERFKDLYLGGSITAGGAATFSGDVTSNNITAPAGFLGGSNGGIRIHSGGTKFFNITAANAARDGIMDIGASDARFKSLYLSGTINSNGAANFEDTIIIEKPQLTNQFDTSSFLRLHPSSTTNSNGYTNMFFGTSTSNNYGVAIGAVRAGTGDTSSNNNPDFVVRILNDSITGTEVLKIDSSSKAHFAGDVAINGATGITGLNGITFENGCILDDSIGAEYLKLKYNGASAGGLQVFDNQNRVQGYLYASGGATSEFGLLNGAGQWGVRTTEGAGTALFYGASSEKLTTTNVGVTFSNLSNTSAASSSVDEVKIGSFGAGRPAIYFGTSNTTYTNSTWFIENIGAAGKLRIGRNGLDIVEIFNDGNTSFAGNLIIHDTSNAPYIDFVESGATSDSKARITMDQIDTDNASLLFATENAGTLYNQVKITQTGNLLLSNDAAAFNTSNAKLNIQPASSGVYTQWNYSNTNETFALKLKETVTAGNVRYVFEQNNNGTTYSNALVFNEGKIGIGTQDPRARGLEIFRAAGLSSTPQLIIATGESGSEDYSLSTDVTAAGDFCIVKGAANVAANVRMKINSSGDISIGGNVNKGKLTVDTSSGNNITIRKGTGQAALAYGGTNADEAVALVEGKAGGGLKWYNGTGTLASPTWTAGMELYDNGRLHPYGGVFLGSSNNSNLLDDYEEGTFTPVLKDLSGNPATLSTAIGTYTKIGRQVIFNYDVRMSSKASMTGNYVHLSLPFNHAASISGTGTVDKFNNMTTAFSSMAWDVTSTVTVAWLVGVEGTSDTNSVYVTVAELSDTSKFKGTIIYHT